jgi:acyl-CoA reductase-like NAD-dependent aldehyde dehydrogenase
MHTVNCCYANKSLVLVSGIHKFSQKAARRAAALQKGNPMSKTAAATFAPSTGIFTRLLASIDRLLAASARVSARNGDLPYFGL